MNDFLNMNSLKKHANKETTYVDLSFDSKWDYIPLAKSFVEDFLSISNKLENIHKVGTASSELLENAVRYSSDNGVRVFIKDEKDENTIYLIISNYADEDHANKLMQRIDEMNSQNSFDYYLYRMKESIKNKEEHSAGLGLARVYHESGAKISVNYKKVEKIIEVKASIPL